MNREEIFEKAREFIVANNKELDKDGITMDSTFEELNMDSLDAITIITDLEKQFNIILSNEEVSQIRTLAHAVDVIEKHITQKKYV
jgi:acyl carrier protein